MPSRRTITMRAHAKVNLALAVAPARPSDGLHPICSWIVPIDLADDLTVTSLPGGAASAFEIGWAPDAPRPTAIEWPVEKDLAARAHALLAREVGRPLPVRLRLAKRTPVGAGLGGGSSDAAACLVALRELFDLPIDDDRLRALGATLGADVPVFLPPDASRPAIVEGVGDRIERVTALRGEVRLLLVMPDFGCPTGAVYRAFDDAPPSHFRAERVRAMARAGEVDPAALFNDLAPPAQRVAPGLTGALETAARVTGLRAHVTGSGSGVFVVMPEGDGCEGFAAGAARAIEATQPGWAARVVRAVA